MMRWLLAILITVSLASCASATPSRPFVDTFDRPATQHGLGNGWDMRGAYIDKFPLPAATDGFLSGGNFTYAGKSVVYATRRLDTTVHQISTEGRWRRIGVGGETTFAMAISANDRLVTDMVHFTASRATWSLTIRQNGGDFKPIASGEFSPALALDQQYEFALEASNDSVTVRVPGNDVTKKVDAGELLGPYVFWEEYPSDPPAGVVFDFGAVSAQ